MKDANHSMIVKDIEQMTMQPGGGSQTDQPKDDGTRHNHNHPQSN